MQCTSCQAEIADKAIVCYRCGTPTAIPASARRPEPAVRRSLLGPLVLVVMALGAAVWFVPRTPPDGLWRPVIYAIVALAVALAVWLARRR